MRKKIKYFGVFVRLQGVLLAVLFGAVILVDIHDRSTFLREKPSVRLQQKTFLEHEVNNDNKKGMYYFASSNAGSVYYRLPCDAIERISEEKRRYFVSLREVEELGLKPSKRCP